MSGTDSATGQRELILFAERAPRPSGELGPLSLRIHGRPPRRTLPGWRA
ncbi:hypothetical protein [Nesterenkonia lutea]|uniref:Uncharacterized protein n=1 Tax=Nesterenkonia lutea TaxID=272919 RepID=A0ABR9JFY0_9MICC|nr:hypothetical protein [Nesterenkonia lutea]